MKKLNWFQKGVFLINVLFALLLLFSFAVSYFPVDSYPKLSILSLAVPPLVILNILFLLYWILKFRRQFLLSLCVLLIGYNKVLSLYKFNGKQTIVTQSAVKVMSYNVRLFNSFKWIKEEHLDEKIRTVVEEENPDILNFQEFHRNEENKFPQFPYRYIEYKSKEMGQAIYSKFPIVNKGSLEFPNSSNNAIYADLQIGNDTVRVYNLHLQSFMINPEAEEISQENSNRIANRMGVAFSRQQEQTDIFVAHRNQCTYREIICGDLNNNQFSSIYHQVRGDALDTFDEEGTGTGKTYYFKYFPLRIDFIFADPAMQVISHKNRYEFYSDHYPIVAQLKMK